MSPKIASILCLAFIVYLLRKERELWPQPMSGALWIPTIWLAISASRPLSMWISGAGGSIVYDSTTDRVYYIVMILGSVLILARRKVSIPRFIFSNIWLSIYSLYALLSILWSHDLSSAFLHWAKAVAGNVMICLCILTEPEPAEAFKTVIRRCSYVLLPVSILWIKYYPHLGRAFYGWGASEYSGVGLNKNYLGYLCLILGYPLFWSVMDIWKKRSESKQAKSRVFIHGILLYMIVHLLVKSNSATSSVSLTIGAGILLILGMPFFRMRAHRIGKYALWGLLILAPLIIIGDELFLSKSLNVTGHEDTFMGRVELWRDLLNLNTNFLIGTGYDSFWTSRYTEALWELRWWKPYTAHSGYVETYVNIGMIGVCLLIIVLISAFGKIQRTLVKDFEFGRMKLGFWIIAILYNVTESAFRGLSPIWLMFLLVAIELPRRTAADFASVRERMSQNNKMLGVR